MKPLYIWTAALLLSTGCKKTSGPAGEAAGALAPDVVAQVGDQRIALDTVQRIAERKSLAPAAALDLALEDALLAIHARDKLPPGMPLQHLDRVVLMRQLLEQINRAAVAQGPPTDEEVKQTTERRWWELDRPELSRTTHAVVQFDKPENEANARRVAEAIASAVRGSTDPQEFKDKAKAVDAAGLTVTIQDLPPVAADGRAVDPARPRPAESATQLYPAFAQAAAALSTPGTLSPVVKSEAGYHVILLVERLPAKQIPFEQRRQLLTEEIHARRAQAALTAVLDPLRASTPVVIAESAVALTGLIRIAQ